MKETSQTGPADDTPLRLLPCDVRPKIHLPKTTTDRYITDKSGTVTYHFNSLGYRGEELDPDAAFRICLIGESHAIGLGVEMRDTYGQRLKRHIGKALGLAPKQVNCINLSVSGASSDYCVRTAFRQLTQVPVDLAVCCIPAPNRMEYCRPAGYEMLNLNGLTPENMDRAPVPLVGFADFYNDRMGLIALMKNTLLLQDFFKRRGIGYVLTSQHLTRARRRFDYLKVFDDDLDTRAFLEDRIFALRPDRAADGAHGGPRTHAAFAIAVLDRFAAAQRDTGDPALAEKLARYVAVQKRKNPDWAFVRAAQKKAMQRAKAKSQKGAAAPVAADPQP